MGVFLSSFHLHLFCHYWIYFWLRLLSFWCFLWSNFRVTQKLRRVRLSCLLNYKPVVAPPERDGKYRLAAVLLSKQHLICGKFTMINTRFACGKNVSLRIWRLQMGRSGIVGELFRWRATLVRLSATPHYTSTSLFLHLMNCALDDSPTVINSCIYNTFAE